MRAKTNQDFKLYGIFGFPLGHTLSPVMHEAAFRKLSIKAFYLPFEVRREDFRRLMKKRARLLLDGFNVTVPYKEEALRWLDKVSPAARAIGAVNTAVRKGKRWYGFNTDSFGFITSLEKDGEFGPRGKRALILGAGGSARAVVYALAKRGIRQITIVNRTRARAKKIAIQYERLFPRVSFLTKDLKAGCEDKGSREVDLVVNATSVGLRPGDRSLISSGEFPKKTLFVDLIYRPTETRLLRLARQSGHRTLNGLGMLVYQGTEAFRLWTGRRAPVDVMRAAIHQRALRAH